MLLTYAFCPPTENRVFEAAGMGGGACVYVTDSL